MPIEGFKFSYQEQDELRSIDGDIEVIEQDLKKAESVGLDVNKQLEQVKNLRTTRDGLLKQFSG